MAGVAVNVCVVGVAVLHGCGQAGGGDEFMAVKPWLGTILNTVPSVIPKVDPRYLLVIALPVAMASIAPPPASGRACCNRLCRCVAGWSSPPDVGIELEWVHGYRSDDCRNNVRYNADGEIVYCAAGVGIAYSQEKHQQRYDATGEV